MVIKCYDKPNRSKPRYFKTCDAARISREVIRDDPETTPEEVLACIAKQLGFTHISLSRQRVVESSLVITKLPTKATILITISVLIKLAKISKRIAKILGPVIALLRKIIDAIDKIERLFDIEQAPVDDVINPDKCRCKPKAEVITDGNR